MEEALDDSRLADGEKFKSKKEGILEAQRDKKKVHCATLMDLCRLKKCGVRTKATEVQKAESCSRCDIVKDDSGATQFFTEQGSSASQMTAAKNHGCYCEITRL